MLLLTLVSALACGKYGPPLRPSEREAPAEAKPEDSTKP
jgi:predicted small lipoprotein YifL